MKSLTILLFMTAMLFWFQNCQKFTPTHRDINAFNLNSDGDGQTNVGSTPLQSDDNLPENNLSLNPTDNLLPVNGMAELDSQKNIEFDWNVKDGPVPPNTSTAVGNGTTDDGPAIQSILDAAENGDVIYFPSVPVGYRIRSGFTLNIPSKNLTLIGDGWLSGGPPTFHSPNPGQFSNSKLIRTESVPTGIMIDLSSHTTIDGLWLDGNNYGQRSTATGIQNIETTNTSVLNSKIEGFSGQGMYSKFSEDILVKNTFLTRNTYAGLMFRSTKRSHVIDVGITDIGIPENGEPYINNYPYTLTAERGKPDELAEDGLALRLYVEGNPIWYPIHNHGSHRFLVLHSAVRNGRYGIEAQGDYPTMRGQHIIDCIAENISQSVAMGGRGVGGQLSLIGNQVLRGSAPIRLWRARDDAIVTWNQTSSSAGYLMTAQAPLSWTEAHNSTNGSIATWTLNVHPPENNINQTAPASPTNFTVQKSTSQTTLSWEYGKGPTHDSFYVEYSEDNISWQRLAYLPPNNGVWDFKLPTNPNAPSYNPLKYRFPSLSNGNFFRIRANQGAAFSSWALSQPSNN